MRDTDIPSSMEHGGRLAELQYLCMHCGISLRQHLPESAAGHAWEWATELGEEGDVQLTRESVRVDGLGDNPGGSDDAAGADGEQGALGELDAVELLRRIEQYGNVLYAEAEGMQHRISLIHRLVQGMRENCDELRERSKEWNKL